MTSAQTSIRRLPYLIEASSTPDVKADPRSFLDWFQGHREDLEARLLEHGALLFRGFGLSTPAAFARFVKTASQKPLDYVDGNSPRTRITRGVYTSTEYPAPYFISLHNELSYSHTWPQQLYFCCIVEPDKGGATVLVDSRELLRRLDPEIVDEFSSRGILYIRNLHGGDGLGPSWQDTFEISDRDAVEEYFREVGMSYDWKPDGSLQVRQERPALWRHPKTDEEVWFNQADQFHPSTHPREIYDSLIELHGDDPENLPQYVRFGDGGEIDVESLESIRETTRELMVPVEWQQGDLLVVDNVLAAHGRMPFEGSRKILVSMS